MSPESAPDQRSRSRLARRLFAAVVSGVSIAWVIRLFAKVWPELAAHSAEIRVVPLLFGFALSLAASWLTFEVFVTLVRIRGNSVLFRRELSHLYFTAQLLKHLPGRIWGIGYQWTAGGSAGSLGEWVLVNLAHMVLATFFALWSAAIALGFSSSPRWELFALAGGGLAYIAGWCLVSSPRAWRWLEWLPNRLATASHGLQHLLSGISAFTRLWIFVLFSVSSLLYYVSWFLYGVSYPPLGGGGVHLCALYMLAWFVGYVSLLTPSGLGVRELVFAWLAKDVPGDAVALLAVIGRVSLLSVDLTMGMMFAPFSPRKS